MTAELRKIVISGRDFSVLHDPASKKIEKRIAFTA
jgi:hypothetical protein